MAADPRADWVRRVLGVDASDVQRPAAPGGPFDEAAFHRSFRDAVATWQDAADSVDTQLDQLRRALLDTDDPALHRIAEYGLNGITGKRKVGLQTALRDVGSASGTGLPTLAAKAAKAAEAYRGFVQSDARIKACDRFPGIKVPIGPTLGNALGTLAKALAL